MNAVTFSSKRLGWGIVSTGHIASVLAQDLALVPDDAALVAVSSRSLDKARAFAEEYGFARGYGSVAELAADPEVDVVYVASVHNDHLESARICLEAGKAVLVEKPLTVTAADTDALLDLAGARGVFAMEAVWTRTNPVIRRAIEIAGSGEIGDVRHVSAQFGFRFDGDEDHRLLDPAQAGGAILDLGVYPAHAVEMFLGAPAGLTGFGWLASTGVDAHAAATLDYPATADRPAATADILCTMAMNLPTSLAVYGTTGRIVIDDFFILPRRMVVHRDDAEPEVIAGSWPGQGYGYEIAEVTRCVRAGELESPMVPWSATRAVARMLDAWRDSLGADQRETRPTFEENR